MRKSPRHLSECARHALIAALATALVAGCTAEAATQHGDAPKVRLERRQPLNGVARALLEKRMARHGGDMQRLLAAVLALDYDATAAVSANIANEPRLARPGPGSETANALFPETFFVFQDALHDEASHLAEAARAGDDAAIAQSFSRVTATCVGCHAVYLRMPGEKPKP